MSKETITPASFDTMDLSSEILRAVRAMGFQEPSTVQAKTIPLMMNGQDINAIAPTGTGKTCAFGIPMLEYVQLKDSRVQGNRPGAHPGIGPADRRGTDQAGKVQ